MTELGVAKPLEGTRLQASVRPQYHPRPGATTVTDPDGELVAGVAAGEPRAARVLVDRHLQRMVNVARRVLGNQADAEEVAQEVFLRAWKQAPKWKPGGAKFETWMTRVALNLCYDRLRKKREITGDNIPELADDAADPNEALQQKELAGRVNEALQRLPDRQRTAIVLCHTHGYSNIEAAEAMEISVEAIESLLSRGRRKLKELLRSEVDEWIGTGQ